MARSLNTANIDASNDVVVRPIGFVELEYDNEWVRLHTGIGEVTWGGQTWLGVGDLGSIDNIEETNELQVNGISLGLSGINNDLLDHLLNKDYQGRPLRIYMGWLDADFQLIADPELVFFGYMDTQSVSIGETSTINITAENRLVDWDRARVLRFNNETQQARFFGDRGFEFVEQAAERKVVWGQKDN